MTRNVMDLAEQFGEKLAQGEKLWLILDYDGTLADFAPTPDDVLPDQDLIALLRRLAQFRDTLHVVVLSGRRLKHILELLPVRGILSAGTYGIEFRNWEGERVELVDFERGRPFLDLLKKQWQALLNQYEGFYLEDKGYALSIHARLAPEDQIESVLKQAADLARQDLDTDTFRVQFGYKFLEVAPTLADKGQSVDVFLHRFGWEGEPIVCFGDEDTDELAFKVVKQHAGIPVLVSKQERPTEALYRVAGPPQVRKWLETLLETLEKNRSKVEEKAG